MVEKNIEKLVEYIEQQGIEVDKNMRKVLDYFDGMDVVLFVRSGFGHSSPDVVNYVSKNLDIPYDNVAKITGQLEMLSLLGTERGMGSIAGREHIYGFTGLARSIYK